MFTGRTIDTAFERQALPLCCRYLVVIFRIQHMEVRLGELERDQVARWALGVLADGQSELLGSGPKPNSVAMPSQEVIEGMQARGVEHNYICFAAANETATLSLAGRAATTYGENRLRHRHDLHRRTPCDSNSLGHDWSLEEPDSKSKNWKPLQGLKQRGWTYCEGRCQATDVEQGDVALTALDAAEIAAGQPALKCQPFL